MPSSISPDTLIAQERAALDRWGKGDPGGYLSIYDPEITYFDPARETRADGLPALQALLRTDHGQDQGGSLRNDRTKSAVPRRRCRAELSVDQPWHFRIRQALCRSVELNEGS